MKEKEKIKVSLNKPLEHKQRNQIREDAIHRSGFCLSSDGIDLKKSSWVGGGWGWCNKPKEFSSLTKIIKPNIQLKNASLLVRNSNNRKTPNHY